MLCKRQLQLKHIAYRASHLSQTSWRSGARPVSYWCKRYLHTVDSGVSTPVIYGYLMCTVYAIKA